MNLGILLVCLGFVAVDSYPSSCEEMKTRSGATDDGEYCILIQNNLVSIYCHNMSSTIPRNYVTLRTPPGSNKSQYNNTHPHTYPRDDTTVFSKIALNIQKLEVIADDFTFSTSSNISERQDYGKAKSCQWDPYVADTTMSINLTGTPFRIAESVVFRASGHAHPGHNIAMDLHVSPDRRQVTCSVGGGCAQCLQDNKILLDVEGSSGAYAPLVTKKKTVCSLYCSQNSNCKSFLFSAGLSECVLLSAPSLCGTGHILEGFKYYEQISCGTTQDILQCTYIDIEIL